jgi:hypothetical protein
MGFDAIREMRGTPDHACPAVSDSRIGSTFNLAKARRHFVS